MLINKVLINKIKIFLHLQGLNLVDSEYLCLVTFFFVTVVVAKHQLFMYLRLLLRLQLNHRLRIRVLVKLVRFIIR